MNGDDEDVRDEVRRLRERVGTLERRLDALEGPSAGDRAVDSRRDAEPPAETPADRDAEPASSADEGADGPASAVDLASDDWELAVGVRWLGIAGALALVVGVVFFIRYAIEAGLLGPLGRVAAGTAGGAALFVGGRYAAARQGYVRWGRIAAGAGLAAAYFSLYAAYGFQSYREAVGTPLWAVLVALTLLVAVTAVLSVRDRAPLVAGEAFLLGYVTAALSTDAATLVVTPAYVLLLAAGLIAIATVTPWSWLLVSSLLATYGVVGLWVVDLDPPGLALGAVAVAACLLYLLGGYVLRARGPGDRRAYRIQLVALTAVNAAFAAILLEAAVRRAFPEAAVEGLGAIAVAGLLAGAYAVTERRPVRRDDAAAVGAVVLLAAGIAMATGTFAATVGALAVICGAVVLADAADAPGFRFGAHGVAAALALKLLVVDAAELPPFDPAEPIATITGRPVAFALSIGAFYALSWWLSNESSLTGYERGLQPSISGAYAAAATALTVVALGLELSGLELSIAWALFGFALLGVGLRTDRRGIRLLGVAVLGVATAKVFLYDTSDLDVAARTLSFLILGAVLLAASYVYARSRGDIDADFGSTDREGG